MLVGQLTLLRQARVVSAQAGRNKKNFKLAES